MLRWWKRERISRAGVKIGRRSEGDLGSEGFEGGEGVVLVVGSDWGSWDCWMMRRFDDDGGCVVVGFGLLGSFALGLVGLSLGLDPWVRFIVISC